MQNDCVDKRMVVDDDECMNKCVCVACIDLLIDGWKLCIICAVFASVSVDDEHIIDVVVAVMMTCLSS